MIGRRWVILTRDNKIVAWLNFYFGQEKSQDQTLLLVSCAWLSSMTPLPEYGRQPFSL